MTTKIAFDLELWKSGKYDVVTRGGMKATIIYVHDNINIEYPVVALIYYVDEIEPITYTSKGIHFLEKSDIEELDEYDLFLVPKKKKLCLGIYKTSYKEGVCHNTTCAYSSIEEVKNNLSSTRWNEWNFVEIEIEDGKE